MFKVRQLSLIDHVIIELDKAITTVVGKPETTQRHVPGNEIEEATALSTAEQRHSAGLMRVNHSGEVSAQALYQGQALTAKLPEVRQAMEQAALEENDHLVWCAERLSSLSSHRSVLNPVWYIGSFAIGAVAGKIGDKWSLGFVAETEKQVVNHLDEHLAKLSANDLKSRAVLEQMREDELHHRTTALEAGGAELPRPVKTMMSITSKVMTKTSYWI
ncbi:MULTISPECIES: 2-polyprenyl-3-methyl-6-methoxy-1,4-benzoquinone monooxygenase [Methylophaga]|uniref:3-demethoxyubiquinol 3-hydroxylase n=1 Tax=Methylophaga marina TaxID=45495 RepID=A0ABP3DKM3_9GAMM|nr:2-polyprenyl-3-methyl-6-methoxy-1,4-benzoquinone monooxygenase [Methylophaga marina]BDZ74892.1 2-nonaprenyl-3-methyl-6-methoxy-1,4-benzoquinol hydroxylase [Methylophaga marina]